MTANNNMVATLNGTHLRVQLCRTQLLLFFMLSCLSDVLGFISPSPFHVYSRLQNDCILSGSSKRFQVKSFPVMQQIGDEETDSSTDEHLSTIENEISEVDVRHGVRISLTYDPVTDRFLDSHSVQGFSSAAISRRISRPTIEQKVRQIVVNAFLPEGVTKNYYTFIKWRIVQRFINANVNVFGTQSLLMGLGIQNKRATLGLSAALNWVLKDALGKLVRMCWASQMGRKFDPDAKRWRYRSSLLFALGNGLEVMTYVFPYWFLLLATLANSLKQMSMLTSSSTRNALYNSFRDGTKENIGDITAKGEAQIAIVDLLGIMSGVCLSRTIGTSVRSVLSIWILLQIVEVTCVYKQLTKVVFRMLNFERLWHATEVYLDFVRDEGSGSGKDLILDSSASEIGVPTPEIMAKHERIFLPPNHLARRGISFGSMGRAKLSPEELSQIMNIFKREKFILVVGKNVKRKHFDVFNRRIKLKDNRSDKNIKAALRQLNKEVQESCHIVLHADASNSDIVKSTLALGILRRKLSATIPSETELIDYITKNGIKEATKMLDTFKTRRSRDSMVILQECREETDNLFGLFLKVLSFRGWATPARFMFGRVSMRAEWKIQR